MMIDYKINTSPQANQNRRQPVAEQDNAPEVRRKFRWVMLGSLLGLTALFVVLMLNSTPTHSASSQLNPPELNPSNLATAANTVVQEIVTEIQESVELDVPWLPTITTMPWERITVKDGDNLSLIFDRLGLSAAQLHRVINLEHWKQVFKRLLPGDSIEVVIDKEAKQLQALRYEPNHISTLLIKHTPDGFESQIIERPLETRLAFVDVTIDHSLFIDGKNAGLNDNLIMQTANLFAWDIDFILDIRQGDSYRLLYEAHYRRGERVGTGDVVAAEFNTRGRHFQAIRHIDSDGRKQYYTPEGASLRKAFIRTPVDFTRISSHFDLNRTHPVLHTVRAHRGVDYAAPTGTPIRAAGDGKIIRIQYSDGYGYFIELQHGTQYTTLYAHMSRYADGMQQGTQVRQNQVIGYVGSTGLATGPHLHFEFRVDGVHRDPLTVELPTADPIPSEEKATFLANASALLEQLETSQALSATVLLVSTDEFVGPLLPPTGSALATSV